MIQYDKYATTQKILSLLPKNCSSAEVRDWPLDKVVYFWWQGGRSSSFLRLKIDGKRAFDDAGIIPYKIPLINGDGKPLLYIPDHTLLKFGKKMRCPWYVNTSKYLDDVSGNMLVYDSKIAMLIQLYGSIDNYLESIN